MKRTSEQERILNIHRVKVIGLLRASIPRLSSYSKLTKRVQTALAGQLPEYAISVYTEDSGFANIRIWGNGLESDDMHFMWLVKPGEDWITRFSQELDRHDPSDTLERQEQEKKLFPRLSEIEDAINVLRAEASLLIERLPVPISATLRAHPVNWNTASPELREMFPATFKNE